MTMIWPTNAFATVGGLSVWPMTSPLPISFLATPRMLNPMLSPGSALVILTWCVSIVLHSPTLPDGQKITLSPSFNTPVSTRPTGTVPTPVIVYTSWIGTLNGLLSGFGGGVNWSNASRMVAPLYHGVLALFLARLSPFHPLVGTKGILLISKPTVLSKPSISFLHSRYRGSSYLTVWSSILLTATMRFLTPRVRAR